MLKQISQVILPRICSRHGCVEGTIKNSGKNKGKKVTFTHFKRDGTTPQTQCDFCHTYKNDISNPKTNPKVKIHLKHTRIIPSAAQLFPVVVAGLIREDSGKGC